MGWYTDPVRFRQVGTAVCFLVGGSLFLLGMVATNWEGDDSLHSYLDSLAADPTRAQIAALLLHFSACFLAAGVFGAAGLVRRRGVGLAHTALIFAVFGATTMAGLLVIDFYDLAIAETLPRDQGVALEEKVGSYPALYIMVLPAFLGTIVGMALALFALWRARFVPLWVPATVLATYATGELSRGLSSANQWAGPLVALILLVPYTYVGVRLLRLTPEQWMAGEASAEARLETPSATATNA